MVQAGLVEEVRGLLSRPGGMSMQARPALGYQEIIEHLSGKMTLDEAVEAIKIHTRRFAKQQRTWFRRFPGVHWIDAGPGDSNEELARRVGEVMALG